MTNQGHDKKYQENKEQNLSDSRGSRGNHAKAQQPCDYRDNEENQSVVQHLYLLLEARRHAFPCAFASRFTR
jgi:hypothetical protein